MKWKRDDEEEEEMRQKEAEPDMERSGVVTRTVVGSLVFLPFIVII